MTDPMDAHWFHPASWQVGPGRSNPKMHRVGHWRVTGDGGVDFEVACTGSPRALADFIVDAARRHDRHVQVRLELAHLHYPVAVHRNAGECGHDPHADGWGDTHFEVGGIPACLAQVVDRACAHCRTDDGSACTWPCRTAEVAGLADVEVYRGTWRRLVSLEGIVERLVVAASRALSAGRSHLLLDELPEEVSAAVDARAGTGRG